MLRNGEQFIIYFLDSYCFAHDLCQVSIKLATVINAHSQNNNKKLFLSLKRTTSNV